MTIEEESKMLLEKLENKHEESRKFLDEKILFISSGALVLSANTFINQTNLINNYLLIVSLSSFLISILLVLFSYHFGEKVWAFLHKSLSEANSKFNSNNYKEEDSNIFNQRLLEADKNERKIQTFNFLSLSFLFFGMLFLGLFAILKVQHITLNLKLFLEILSILFIFLLILLNIFKLTNKNYIQTILSIIILILTITTLLIK